MSRITAIQDLPWTEYDRRIRDEKPVILVPVGALEQHGPHLPMN
jgi:creatinine amidohydrolase